MLSRVEGKPASNVVQLGQDFKAGRRSILVAFFKNSICWFKPQELQIIQKYECLCFLIGSIYIFCSEYMEYEINKLGIKVPDFYFALKESYVCIKMLK